jgi:Tol biopolymer transport system component
MKVRHLIGNSFRVILFLSLTFLTLAPGACGQTRAEDLFQQALRTERVTGDLEAAIRLYQQVVDTGDRTLGARALVRIAESYEKLGRQGARETYARIIEEFGDQTEQVALARERLAALERPTAAHAAEPHGITMRRVHKTTHGEDVPLAIAPNGRDLVYLDLWSGNLAVRNLPSDQTRDLTADSSWSAWGAQVSPDGQTVAYVMGEGATSSLHLVGMDGSGPRVLYREVGCPVWNPLWTPNGEQIVALRRCGDEDPGVVRLSLPSGHVEVMAELKGLEGLSLSPEGRLVVYDQEIAEDAGNFDIGVLSLEEGTAVSLVRHPAHDNVLGWVPGSDEVLFLSDRDGNTDAWAIRVSEHGAVGPPRLVQRDLGQAGPLGFSRDASFFFNRYKRWFSTGVAPFDPVSGTMVLESSTGILGSNMQPAWSPDGKYLAFVPEIEGPKGSGGPYRRPLHIYHLASGVKQELASHLQTRNPQWSPDGRCVIVSARDTLEETERYEGGLYTVDTQSGEVSQVLELDPATKTSFWADLSAVWSADGRAIIYGLYDNSRGEGRLVWLDLQSGRERELFRDSALTSRQYALSLDGRRLVFGVRNDAHGYSGGIHSGGRLMILDLDDGTVEELHRISEEGRVYSLQWSPDGNHVLYTKRGEEGTSVWRVPLSGDPAERTWTFGEDCYDAFLSLSPDGRQAAYTTYHQENEVWVMENLREVLLEILGR